MKKSILCLLVASFLSGCGGSDSAGKTKTNDENGKSNETVEKYTCLPGVSIPSELLGDWEREFDRNGSSGKQVINISLNCEFDSIEIGDSTFMEEWYAPLDSNRVYKFTSTPLLKITDINDKELYLDDSAGFGEITDYKTGESVVKWDLASEGGYFGYEINNNTLTLKYTYSASDIFTYSYTKVKP